jgi:hypothetical protein
LGLRTLGRSPCTAILKNNATTSTSATTYMTDSSVLDLDPAGAVNI